MFCTQCGSSMPQGSKFCGACGEPRTETPSPRDTSTEVIKSNYPVVDDAISEDWYVRLTEGQRTLLWCLSLILILVYGIGLLLIAILLFKELGRPRHAGFYKASFGRILLGADTRRLTNNEGRRSNVSHGVLVTGVIYDTPAFDSGIVPGDIIKGINSQPIHSPSALSELLARLAGQLVKIDLNREGQALELQVQLNA